MVKRLIASRKLARHCIYCNKKFVKGQVYYKKRTIIDCDGLYSHEYLICPKCKYNEKQHAIRFINFVKKCTHPKEFIITQYSYIQGEAVQEPSHDYCQLCGKIV